MIWTFSLSLKCEWEMAYKREKQLSARKDKFYIIYIYNNFKLCLTAASYPHFNWLKTGPMELCQNEVNVFLFAQ